LPQLRRNTVAQKEQGFPAKWQPVPVHFIQHSLSPRFPWARTFQKKVVFKSHWILGTMKGLFGKAPASITEKEVEKRQAKEAPTLW
jgi:hypothetical protein